MSKQKNCWTYADLLEVAERYHKEELATRLRHGERLPSGGKSAHRRFLNCDACDAIELFIEHLVTTNQEGTYKGGTA